MNQSESGRGADNIGRLRNSSLEKIVLGDIALHAGQGERYFDGGLTIDCFADGDNRTICSVIHELRTNGIAIDWSIVRAGAERRGVPASYVVGLVDGIPKQADNNVREHIRQLEAFSRARRFYYHSQKAVGELLEDPAAINNGFLSHRRKELQQLEDEIAGPSDLLIDDVALMRRPAPNMLVDGRVVASSLLGLIAPPNAGKTHVALALSFAVLTRSAWLGADTGIPGQVIYIVAEGFTGIQKRVRAWKQFHGLSLEATCGFWIYPRALNLLDLAAVTTFIRVSRPLTPALVVIDLLARCMVGGDENSAGDMGRVIDAADQIRVALDAAVLLVHHTTKNGGAERGSSALRGALDTLIALTPTDDLLTMSCEKQKDLPAFAPIALRLEPWGDSCIVRLAHQTRPARTLSPIQNRCLTVLCDSFPLSTGATAVEWQRAAADVQERAFYRARKVLIDDGFVRLKGARYSWTGKVEDTSGSASLTLTDSATDNDADRVTDTEIPRELPL